MTLLSRNFRPFFSSGDWTYFEPLLVQELWCSTLISSATFSTQWMSFHFHPHSWKSLCNLSSLMSNPSNFCSHELLVFHPTPKAIQFFWTSPTNPSASFDSHLKGARKPWLSKSPQKSPISAPSALATPLVHFSRTLLSCREMRWYHNFHLQLSTTILG